MDDFPVIDYNGRTGLRDILLHGGSRRTADATFALNHLLHGTEVTGYHLVNLAIHLATALTIYFFVSSALKTLRSDAKRASDQPGFCEQFVPLATAMLFVVHPLQTQAVTYIAQRYTSLATLFYLLATLTYIKARHTWESRRALRSTRILASASLAAGLLAVTSKQIAATLPLVLIWLELFLFRGRLFNRRFFIVCAASATLMTAILITIWHDRSLSDMLVWLDQATSEDQTASRQTYALTQTRVIITYLRLLFLPLGQNLFHEVASSTSPLALPVVASLSVHIALIFGASLLYRASIRHTHCDDGQAKAMQRLAALGIIWFYTTMLVESSIFPITDVMFEHRIYLPSIGFFLTIVSLAALAAQSGHIRARTCWVVFSAVIVVLGVATFTRNQLWSDPLQFRLETVRKTPRKDLALVNLADEYMLRNMPEKALPLFVQALELSPYYMTTTKIQLGMTLQRFNIDRQRYTTGEEIIVDREFKRRVVLNREEELKLQVIMYNNLGLAREYLGEPAMAKEHYRSAITINPDYDLAWYNLGLLAAAQGDKGLAVYALAQLKRLNSTREQALARILIPQDTPPLKQ